MPPFYINFFYDSRCAGMWRGLLSMGVFFVGLHVALYIMSCSPVEHLNVLTS